MPSNFAIDDIAPPLSIGSDFISDLEKVHSFVEARLNKPTRALPHISLDGADLDFIGQVLHQATQEARLKAASLVDNHQLTVPTSPLFSSVALFRAMGFTRNETSHTSALAWLLDKSQSHGFKDTLLFELINAIDCHGPDEKLQRVLLDPATKVGKVSAEFQLSRSCRVDIHVQGTFANGDTWLILIEAKIDATERPCQLIDYERALRNKNVLRIFLTPDGRQGTSCDQKTPWSTLSFKRMAKSFLSAYPNLLDLPGSDFLRLYLTGVLEDVCGIKCASEAEKVVDMNNPYNIEALLEMTDA